MRIVYYTPPSTPTGYFWLAIKATLLAYAGLAGLYFLFSFTSGGNIEGNGVFGFFHNIFSGIAVPIFNWAGLTGISTGRSGLYIMFLFMFLPALLNAIPMMRLKLEQLALLDEAYGPVRQPEHRRWFGLAATFLLGAFFLRYLAIEPAEGLMQISIDCTRLSVFLTCLTAGVCFIVIGTRLQASWQKSPAAVKLPGEAKKKKTTHLKVAVDNTTPARPNGMSPAPMDTGLYVALTAEIIQAAGRTGQLPAASDIEEPMQMLQKAALMTRSGQLSHPDLAGLCERACTLLNEGGLQHLPDLKTALALYKRANPAQLTDIAAELKKLLET